MSRLAREHPEDDRYQSLEGQYEALTEREDYDDGEAEENGFDPELYELEREAERDREAENSDADDGLLPFCPSCCKAGRIQYGRSLTKEGLCASCRGGS